MIDGWVDLFLQISRDGYFRQRWPGDPPEFLEPVMPLLGMPLDPSEPFPIAVRRYQSFHLRVKAEEWATVEDREGFIAAKIARDWAQLYPGVPRPERVEMVE